MKKSRKKIPAVLFSLGICICATLTFALIFAVFLSKAENVSKTSGILAIMIFPAAGILTAILSTYYKGEYAIKECLISSSVVSAILILLGLIFSGGESTLGVLINSAILILTSLAVSYAVRPKSKRHRR